MLEQFPVVAAGLQPAAGIPVQAQEPRKSRFKHLLIAAAAALALTAAAATFYFKSAQDTGPQSSGKQQLKIESETPNSNLTPDSFVNAEKQKANASGGGQTPPRVKPEPQTAKPPVDTAKPPVGGTDKPVDVPFDTSGTNWMAVARREENQANYCKAYSAAQKAPGANGAYLNKLKTSCDLYQDQDAQ